jgi:predicted MPP superfamily phosphohydrolase
MSDRPRPLSRRAFLRAARNLLAAGVIGAPPVIWYSGRIEPAWLSVERHVLRLPRLPRTWDGVTLAQLSDLHLGPIISSGHIQAVIDLTLSLQPDLIVVTGDFVSSLQQGEATELEKALRRLRAPAGVFASLGNHDWWTNAAVVAEAVQRSGVTLLRNEHVALGENFYVAGVDDVWEGQADLARALRGLPDEACTVLLAHEPDYADLVANDGRVALQLSGHSHGGQVRIPFVGPTVLPYLGRKYPAGWRQIGNLQLYTNRGLGMVSPAVRFNCRPEITLFTLQRL